MRTALLAALLVCAAAACAGAQRESVVLPPAAEPTAPEPEPARALEPARETARETPRESASEPARETARESARESASESARESALEPARSTPPASASELGAGAETEPCEAPPPCDEPATAPAERPAVEVVVGAFAFDGNWYQDGSTHRHDIATPFARKLADGLEVTLARDRDHGNVDLILRFQLDADGQTVVSPKAQWYAPRRARGRSESGALVDLRGFVQLQQADWSPGNALNCRFAFLGEDRSRTVFLTGEFLVRNPAR